MPDFKFGTSGWRAKIADEFTFGNVEILAQAIADYIKEKGFEEKGVIVGYDNRYLSPEFAHACAKVLAGNGIKAYLSKNAMPTPSVSHAIIKYKAAGGINITASHNPAYDNGLKFNDENGKPSSKEIGSKITENALKVQESGKINKVENSPLIECLDNKKDFIDSILKLIDIDVIKKSKLTIVVNPMFGAGIGYTADVLKELGCNVIEINNYRDALFGGIGPDVSKKNMEAMKDIMKQNNAHLGVGMDGDADRFGIIDNEGFISPNQVLYLLMYYLMKTRGWKTCVSRSVATTYMMDRIGQKYGIEVIETPVGFKYIGETLLHNDAFIGGEESGGLSIKGHVPEKDGVLACLLVVEMVAKLGKSPTAIMEDLKGEIGYLYNDRLDIHFKQEDKEKIMNSLEKYNPELVADKKVIERNTIDGTKLVMEDGSWVLVRPSGTEPIFKLYAEGNSDEQVKQIHNEVTDALGLR